MAAKGDDEDRGPSGASPRRPHVGYDVELRTYRELRLKLLRDHPGKFVVVVGEAHRGPFATHREAIRAGLEAFGRGPLYVKALAAYDPTVDFAELP